MRWASNYVPSQTSFFTTRMLSGFVCRRAGFWFFHCHTDTHLAQGMALLIRVGDYSDLPPMPSEFPRCGGMGFSNANREQNRGEKACPTNSAPHVPMSAFIALPVLSMFLNMVFRCSGCWFTLSQLSVVNLRILRTNDNVWFLPYHLSVTNVLMKRKAVSDERRISK